jgi:tRNA uridine 5-carbamoylmethylation protein Kti12
MVAVKNNLVFIILSGIPCSGKTTWIKQNIDKIAERHDAPVTVISKDIIREEIYKTGQQWKWDKEKERAVNDKFYKQLGQAATLQHAVVIVDNTHTSESRIDRYFNIFRSMILNGNIKVCVKFFDVPFYKAIMRNVLRRTKTGKWIPYEHMCNYHENYNKINKLKYAEDVYYDEGEL